MKERIEFFAGGDWRMKILLNMLFYDDRNDLKFDPKNSRINVIDGAVYKHKTLLFKLNKEVTVGNN